MPRDDVAPSQPEHPYPMSAPGLACLLTVMAGLDRVQVQQVLRRQREQGILPPAESRGRSTPEPIDAWQAAAFILGTLLAHRTPRTVAGDLAEIEALQAMQPHPQILVPPASKVDRPANRVDLLPVGDFLNGSIINVLARSIENTAAGAGLTADRIELEFAPTLHAANVHFGPVAGDAELLGLAAYMKPLSEERAAAVAVGLPLLHEIRSFTARPLVQMLGAVHRAAGGEAPRRLAG